MSEVWIAEKRSEKAKECKEEKKKTSQAKVSELHTGSGEIPKKALFLNFPLRNVATSSAPSILIPRINVIPCISVKLDVINTKAPQSRFLSLNLRIPQKLPRDIKVQVYEPLKIAKLTCPSLNLKLKPPRNWSIRPLLEPLTMTNLGLLNPSFRCGLKRIERLEILPTPFIKSGEICMPKIQVAQTYFTMEEIRRVIYNLWLTRFDEDFIIECIKRAYGKVLSLNEVRKIIAEGEKGNVEIIGTLPTYVNRSINAIIAEKGGIYLRGTQTKLTLPEEVQRYKTKREEVSVELAPKLSPEDVGPIYELIFEEKSGKGVGGAVTYSGETVYVILEKPFLKEYECKDTFHYLCIRSLREYVGKAETRAISGEYGKDEVERYLGERDITVIDKEKLKEKGLVKETEQGLILEIKEEALADRLREFAEGPKFVIFYVAPKEAQILYEKLWKLRSKFHDKIFWVAPKQTITLEDVLIKISKLIWAFVDMPEVESYDDIFGYGKNAYYKKLEEIRDIVKHGPEKPYPIVKTHRPGPESLEHYLLKCFIAKSFVDKPPEETVLSREPKEKRYKKIKFEYEWERPLKIISDAYVEDDKIAIEVETLFEEGEHGGEPIAKIRDETVEKYVKNEIPINKLWILMENLTMARHLRELLVLRDLYKRRREKGETHFSVDFFTLDLKNERLMPIEEFALSFYDIKKSLNPTTNGE